MKAKIKYPGFVVAGTSSSAGKTLLTLGIMEALRRRGLIVAPFKAGPDYIDAGLHAALLGRPSYNLDTWMTGVMAVKKTFAERSAGADVAVVEGVMGLYDGVDGRSVRGSTAHLAKLLGLPVILVVNAEKTARSAGAMLTGFAAFDKAVDIRWVVFNKVGSLRHYEILKAAIPRTLRVRCLGYIPRDAGLVMPERHLGLVASGEIERHRWQGFVRKAARTIEEFIDLDALLAAMPSMSAQGKPKSIRGTTAPRIRIGVAVDNAFSFYYEENLEMLRRFGAELMPFSPMNDKSLPQGLSGLYLGGGYPELNAEALEVNRALRAEIKAKARKDLPIFAECGGLIYLGKAVTDKDGRRSEMTGVFPWTTRMLSRRAALGYREVSIDAACPFMPNGGRVRGHEFHYSTMKEPGARIGRVFSLNGGGGEIKKVYKEGFVYRNTLATYIHLHFASNPAFARGFVRLCEKFKKENLK